MPRRRLRWFVAAPLLLSTIGTCGSGAPREGAELSLAGGAGHYRYNSGCGPTYAYDVREVAGYVRYRRRWESGLSFTAEGAGSLGQVYQARLLELDADGNPGQPDEVGTARGMMLVDVRLGYHIGWIGAELGPGLLLLARSDKTDPVLLPSALVWAGQADGLHLWASLLEGAVAGRALPLGGGFAYGGDEMRLRVGGQVGPWGLVDAEWEAAPKLRLGGGLRWGLELNDGDVTALLRVSVDL